MNDSEPQNDNNQSESLNQNQSEEKEFPSPLFDHKKRPPYTYFGFGLCMGTADAVPGVSGGTIALILGYYDEFIEALAQIVSLVKSPFKKQSWIESIEAFKLLIPLVLGAITALYLATKLLVGKSVKIGDLNGQPAADYFAANPPEGLLLNPVSAPYIFAAFFGLVLFSIPQPWKLIKNVSAVSFILAAIGAIIVASISLLNPASLGVNPVLLIISGALAISVMLLPGISGSLVLLIIGMYQPISQAVHNKEFDVLLWFMLGIGIGVITFVPFLKFMLKKHQDPCMAALTGLMIGSLMALWPWKTHYMPKFITELGPMYPLLPENFTSALFAIGAAALGIAIIYALQKIAGER